jgi:hypothetical protein
MPLNELGITSTFSTLLTLPLLTLNVMDKYELPYLYWIPKLHKNPTNKDTWLDPANVPLSLIKILTAVKEKFQVYCATTYARSGVN